MVSNSDSSDSSVIPFTVRKYGHYTRLETSLVWLACYTPLPCACAAAIYHIAGIFANGLILIFAFLWSTTLNIQLVCYIHTILLELPYA